MVSACDLDEVGGAYISLGEYLAGLRSEPSGSEPPMVQAFMAECPGPLDLSIGDLLGREARQVMVETLNERGLVPVCGLSVSADSLAHALVFAGLLAAAEARGDSTASTVRLRIIDEVLGPAVEKLEGSDYCGRLLAEAIRSIIEEDSECLGVNPLDEPR